MSAQVSLARLKRTVQLKASALRVILPDWHRVSDEEAAIGGWARVGTRLRWPYRWGS